MLNFEQLGFLLDDLQRIETAHSLHQKNIIHLVQFLNILLALPGIFLHLLNKKFGQHFVDLDYLLIIFYIYALFVAGFFGVELDPPHPIKFALHNRHYFLVSLLHIHMRHQRKLILQFLIVFEVAGQETIFVVEIEDSFLLRVVSNIFGQ